MSARRWVLLGAIMLAVAIIAMIGILGQQPSPAADLLSTGTLAMSQPAFDHQTTTPTITTRITVTPTPSNTPTFLPPEPTQLTIELSSTPSEGPPATAAILSVSGSHLSDLFDLPSGLYRITLRTDGGFSVMRPVVEEGDCSEFPLFGTWSGPFEGTASYRSTGCKVRFEVVETNDAWSVEVALEVTVISPIFPVTFSGDGPGTSDIIELPEGEYSFHFTTDSAALVTPIIHDGLCLERPIILATQAGTYDAAYVSTGCKLLFQISDAVADWSLLIELKG